MKVSPVVASLIFALLGCTQNIDDLVVAASDGNSEPLIRAAEGGNPEAQFYLAVNYESGNGIPQDYSQALKWMKLAADQGYLDAQRRLAYWHENGQVVPRDELVALEWHRLVAEQGDPTAQHKLGQVYGGLCDYPDNLQKDAYGNWACPDPLFRAVPEDFVHAHMWLNLAASRINDLPAYADVPAYTRDRDAVAAEMTAQQLAEAQRLAREWKPKTWPELRDQLPD